jgi:hypothetical protein
MAHTARSRRGNSSARKTHAARNERRTSRFHVESLEPRQMLSATPLSFHVVDDASTNRDYRYAESGAAQGSTTLVAANSAPRGVATMIGVDKSWVVDANRNVYVYNASGALLGSWTAGTLANNAAPEGIATNGTDIWIVDSKSDKVFRYAGAAARIAGSQTAASSFRLNSANSSPKDIVTDGATLWVVNDASTDKVFKYSTSGALVGSWAIAAANKSPTGIAIDPASVGDIWISDSGTDRVYKYTGAVNRNSGSQSAAATFNLSTSNRNSQGLAVAGRPWAEAPPVVEWVRQFGASGDDFGRGVTTDRLGHVYVSGWTNGPLGGPNPTGATTPFLAQYDGAGNQIWLNQPAPVPGVNIGGLRVATDSSGNVFQVYETGLRSYDVTGALRWDTQLPNGEGIFDVTIDDAGFAYMSSYAGNSVLLRKLDGATGDIVWTRTLDTGGTASSTGVSYDGQGNIYLAGYTYGSAVGPNAGFNDALVAKYDTAGNLAWTRQFGTAGMDNAFAIAADSLGNVYVSGGAFATIDDWNSGNQDIFVTKLDASGNLQWTRKLGTTTNDANASIWADGLGNVYFSGYVGGALGEYPGAALGGAPIGATDLVVGKYSAAGELLWMSQLGSTGIDAGVSIAGDNEGNLYLTARTSGAWGGPNAGQFDAVLIKLSPPPVAASVALASAEAHAAAAPTKAAALDAVYAAGDFTALLTPSRPFRPSPRPRLRA